ncbi:MAG: hypothetical protein Q8K36_06365, partial [Alphaproteobacteria bacterium]|nr:hypothetical protein [Alphaproteobacteria bacterium]
HNPNLTSRTIRAQIASALDMVVYVKRFRDGSRKITEIMDVCYDPVHDIKTDYFFQYQISGHDDGKFMGEYEMFPIDASFKKKIGQANQYDAFMACLGGR